jgi:hypothetical protein
MDFISNGSLWAIITWERMIPGLLCADDLAISSLKDLCIREHNSCHIMILPLWGFYIGSAPCLNKNKSAS